MMTADQYQDLMARAHRVMPGGINTCIRNYPEDFVTTKAEGAYFWDQNGKSYVDYLGAWGPVVIGYGNREIKEKTAQAVMDYDLYGIGVTEVEVVLAEKVTKHMRAVDKMLLCLGGSEATYHAIRATRAYTGREKIVKMQGAFLGWHDFVLMNIVSAPEKINTMDPFSAGMLKGAYEQTLVGRINDLDSLSSLVEKHKGQIAAVILDPFNTPFGCLPTDAGYMRGVRKICDDEGIVLIFDEVVTGFRLGLGGATELYDIAPDFTCLGKGIANGFPVAAVGGKAKFMDLFNTRAGGKVSYQATYYGHPALAAAAVATLEILERPGFYEHLGAIGDAFAGGLNDIAKRLGLPMYCANQGGLIGLFFGPGPYKNYDEMIPSVNTAASTEFRKKMTDRGHYIHPDPYKRITVSYSHSQGDIEAMLNDAEDVLKAMNF